MDQFNRRDFITRGLVGVGSVWVGLNQSLLQASTSTKKLASDQVLLGSTGIKLSRLALGSGTNGVNHSSEQTRLGVKTFSDLLRYGFDQGINFWETADQYGSHPHLNAGLKQVGRNRVVLLTKTHAGTSDEMWADLDRFRKELGTDFIDVVLLHCMMSANWPQERQGAMEVLSKAKEKGIIRAHGVSCHTLEALKVAAKNPWVQVDLARINPIQAHMDSDPATVISVLQEMKKNGKGVIGMKILGAGQLTHDVKRAIEHAVKLDCVDAFTIGFSRKEHLDEVVQKMPQFSAV
ncbi:MAG TPA: aldo/keto reductase [Terriglobia bacterium]|nr:aldo/keto reductase [Terriglobia bacterium]